MIASSKQKNPKFRLSPFAKKATMAMIAASKEAKKENSRFGFPLIVSKTRK
jgi:hypothetical protein